MSDYCERCGGSKSIGFSDADPHGRPCPDCNGGEELDPFRRGIAAERARIVAWLRASAARCLAQAEGGTEVLRQTRIDAGQAVYAHAACVERGEHEDK